MTSGTVFWITGLAGSGKTTLGRALYGELKTRKPNVVLLDGDDLRDLFGGAFGFSPEARKRLAATYSRLCRLLSGQGIDIICCTVSLYAEIHRMNRTTIGKYYEVYVDCDMNELRRRNKKGLYSGPPDAAAPNVIGADLPFDKPAEPDLYLDNSDLGNLARNAQRLISFALSMIQGAP